MQLIRIHTKKANSAIIVNNIMLINSSALEAALASANNPTFATATVLAHTSGAGVQVVNSRTKESVSLLP
jgi:hypothetical protein